MDNNIGLLLSKRSELNPHVEALVDHVSGRRYTFFELNARANRVATALSGRGLKKGDRVAILMMNGVEFVEAFFGLAKIGAVVVPVNWRLVPDELEFIVKNAGASVLIYGNDFADKVSELHCRGSNATDIRAWIEVGGPEQLNRFAEPYVELLATGDPELSHVGARDEDNLFIMYTSGTTGLPKGSVHSHGSFFWSVLTMAATADVRFKDRYAVVLPMFHVGALLPVVVNIYLGATVIMLRAFDPKTMWEIVEGERVTTTLAVPSMLNFMLLVPRFETYDQSSLRWILAGATPVPVTLIERYAAIGIEVHQVYGLTESGARVA